MTRRESSALWQNCMTEYRLANVFKKIDKAAHDEQVAICTEFYSKLANGEVK